MKKILTSLVVSLATLTSTVTIAAPNFDRGSDMGGSPRDRGQGFDRDQDDSIRSERRLRQEQGVQRLKQHRWQTGYIMPQHYRGDAYKADYREFNLPRPSRGQQWYKINNDFILVNSDSNDIVRIMNF
jgi:Ni/Co efflux regulator RcnB